MLSAIYHADHVVLVAASVAAAEEMVSEVLAKLKEVCFTVGAQKTHWSSHPKMADRRIVVDRTAVLWEEVQEFLGSKACLGGKRRRDRAQISSSEQVPSEKETSVEFFMASEKAALEHCEDFNVAGFPLELQRFDHCQSPERHNCELECENGGERDRSEEATLDGNGPVLETVARDGSSMASMVAMASMAPMAPMASMASMLIISSMVTMAWRWLQWLRWRL